MSGREVSTQRAIGYGSGQFALGLLYTGLNLYLLFYYTDVLKIDPTTAGLIFMLPLIWDAVTDPLMGMIATRTRSRFGSFRPYLLFGMPVLALCFIAMFAAPLLFPAALVAASFVGHILFRTAYTMVAIPYSSLLSVMTVDSAERGRLAGLKTMGGIIAGLICAYFTLPLVAWFEPDDAPLGFLKMGALYALVSSMVIVIVFASTFEAKRAESEKSRLSASDTFAFLKSNTAFWLMCGGVFAGAAGSSVGNKSTVYYVTYNANEPSAISTVLALGLVAAAISAPLWSWSYRFLTKRLVWLIGSAGYFIIGGVGFQMAPSSVEALIVFRMLDGICLSAIVVTYWSMLPDTVEYGEWHSGVRDDGVIFGINQFALKSATALGVGVIGLGLGQTDYVASQVQSEATEWGIRALTFLGPMVGYGVSFLLILAYPIDAQLHKRLLSAIAIRRRRALRHIERTA